AEGAVAADGADGAAAADVDADADPAQVQVGLAVGGAGRQADHGYGRDAAVDHDPDIGHDLVGNVFEARVEVDPLLDHGAVRLAGEAVHAAEDIGDVMADLRGRDQRAIAAAEILADPAGDHQDAVAAAAGGRLDDELVVPGQQLLDAPGLVVGLDHPEQAGHGDAGPFGKLLGAQLVVHQREQPTGIVRMDVARVALVHPDDAQPAQAFEGIHRFSSDKRSR